jgi:flagellar protein FliO/FliZ
MHATDWLSFIVSFAVVLALLGVVLYALKKMQNGSLLGMGQRRIRILDTVSIGPRQKIILLRVKDEDILVGITVQQINTLAGFPLTEEENILPIFHMFHVGSLVIIWIVKPCLIVDIDFIRNFSMR